MQQLGLEVDSFVGGNEGGKTCFSSTIQSSIAGAAAKDRIIGLQSLSAGLFCTRRRTRLAVNDGNSSTSIG